MKYLKIYENYVESTIVYGYGRDLFFISKVLDYLGVDLDNHLITPLSNPYDVNAIDFIKEILMNKKCVFTSRDAIRYNPSIYGIILDVIEFYFYKMNYFLKVKAVVDGEIDEFFIDPFIIIKIYDYDADKKPLHKEVKLKKEVEKYNL